MLDETTVAVVRDILISSYMAAGILLTLFLIVVVCALYKALRRLIGAMTSAADNVNKAAENVNRASQSAVEFMIAPANEGKAASFANGMGILIGLISGLRGRPR